MPISGVHTGGVAARIPKTLPRQTTKIYQYVMEIGGGSRTTFLRNSRNSLLSSPNSHSLSPTDLGSNQAGCRIQDAVVSQHAHLPFSGYCMP